MEPNDTLGTSIDRLLERLSTARLNVTELETELREAKQKLMGAVGRQRKAKPAAASGKRVGRPRKAQAAETEAA